MSSGNHYDPARYEPDRQRPRIGPTEERAARAADQLERALTGNMASPYGRKHVWATGREKWEAKQREGQRAAGVVGRRRGRPAKPAPTPAELVADFLTRLTRYQTWVINASYSPGILETERASIQADRQSLETSDLLNDELKSLADVVLQVAVAATE
jgi:hypothetical protein